jgi:hypothetical protein
MKREMLQKVNEAVANFRKVADQQMAEVIIYIILLLSLSIGLISLQFNALYLL